jgi:L-ascorbate metabolism protein UlaG (beta-lactamase superfamily)
MKLIGDERVDTAVLPIGDNFTMGPKDALHAIELIRPKLAVPVHYNTWPLIEQDALAWKSSVEESTPTKVVILSSGDSLSI